MDTQELKERYAAPPSGEAPQDKAQRLMEEVRQRINEVNSIIRHLPDTVRRTAGLHEYYTIGGILSSGATRVAGGEPQRVLSPQPTYIDRGELRLVARKAGMIEPMIWERFPPRNPQEKAEMTSRLGGYMASRPKPLSEEEANFENYFRIECRSVSRKTGQSYQELLTSVSFKDSIRQEFNDIDTIQLIGI